MSQISRLDNESRLTAIFSDCSGIIRPLDGSVCNTLRLFSIISHICSHNYRNFNFSLLTFNSSRVPYNLSNVKNIRLDTRQEPWA